LLACGASALNEYQERSLDSQMERTKSRPIPSGRISEKDALIISLFLILFGSLFLALQSIAVLLLGLFTLLWYNGIYTPLKRKSSLAIVPGALVGALPPVIGWAASGGSISDPKILSFSAFMFIWQIPHFWLLLLMYDDQYRRAGFPTLSNLLSDNQIINITFMWIGLLLISSGLFVISGLSFTIVSNIFLAFLGLATLFFSAKYLYRINGNYRKTFLIINLYVLLILVLISVENII